MDALMHLRDVLEMEIEEICKKNDITPVELDHIDKAVDILKDIETIWAMRHSDSNEVKSHVPELHGLATNK